MSEAMVAAAEIYYTPYQAISSNQHNLPGWRIWHTCALTNKQMRMLKVWMEDSFSAILPTNSPMMTARLLMLSTATLPHHTPLISANLASLFTCY